MLVLGCSAGRAGNVREAPSGTDDARASKPALVVAPAAASPAPVASAEPTPVAAADAWATESVAPDRLPRRAVINGPASRIRKAVEILGGVSALDDHGQSSWEISADVRNDETLEALSRLGVRVMFLPRRSFDPAFPDVHIYAQAPGGANALTRNASAIVRADVIDLGCELIHGSFDEQELAVLRAALLAKRGSVTRGRFVLAGSPWEAVLMLTTARGQQFVLQSVGPLGVEVETPDALTRQRSPLEKRLATVESIPSTQLGDAVYDAFNRILGEPHDKQYRSTVPPFPRKHPHAAVR